MSTGDTGDSSLTIEGHMPCGSQCSCISVINQLRTELLTLHNRIDKLVSLEQYKTDGDRLEANLRDIRTECSALQSNQDEQSSQLTSIDCRLRSLEADSALLTRRQTQLEQALHQVRMQQAGLLASVGVLERHAAACPQTDCEMEHQQQQQQGELEDADESDDQSAIASLKSRLARLELFIQQQQQQHQHGGKVSSVHRRRRQRHQSPPKTTSSSISSASLSDEEDSNPIGAGIKLVPNGYLNCRPPSSSSSGWSDESLHGLD